MSITESTASLPDFLIIGAGKSGTTSLEAYLDQHPDIFLPEKKEPNFFAYEHRSISEFEDEETINHFHISVTKFDEYVKLFEHAKQDQVLGEISNTYMYMPGAMENIQKHIPETKLIAILRQPAERLFSRYMHLVRVSKEPSESFEDLFNRDSIWWDRPDLINEGFYFKNLTKFYNTFDPSKIKILLHEDLLKDREKTLKSICDFLGVKSDFEFKSSTFFNQSGVIKNKSVNKLIGNDSVVIKSLQKVSPVLYKKIKNNAGLKELVEKFRNKNIEKKKMEPELKARITQEIYSEDIQQLAKLIKRDLSHWSG